MKSSEISNRFDVIIVGSGAGGAAAAYGLTNAGLRVLLIEKGNRLPKNPSTLDINRVVHEGAFKSHEVWRDGRGRKIIPEEYFNLGGKTKWYGAALLRYSPEEFEADTEYRCVSWPISYSTLAPYYTTAEQRLDARKFQCERDLQTILVRLEKNSPDWISEPLPLGLSPRILDNANEAAHFDGFASPADLKGDADTAFLSAIREHSNFTLLDGTSVANLIGDATNPSRIVGVRLQGGQELFAQAVCLAAGALHSPRLLQRYMESSGLDRILPAYNNVGRNLKLHLLTAAVAVSLT